MKISEVAEVTGLDISTIRFYERKGLISPARVKERTYRAYTEEDVKCLKTIILYRKMNFSIELISRIMKSETDILSALQFQEERLKDEKAHLEGALDLVQKLISDQATEPLDLDYYLNYTKEEEKQGRKYPEIMETLEGLAEHSVIKSYLPLPLWGYLMRYKWVRCLAGTVLTLILILFPIIMVITKTIEWNNGQGGPQAFVAWLFILVIFWGGFVNIIKKVRDR